MPKLRISPTTLVAALMLVWVATAGPCDPCDPGEGQNTTHQPETQGVLPTP